MADSHAVIISAVVEGDLDEAMLRCLIERENATLERVYGKRGKSHLKKRIDGYNRAARLAPWVVLMDLDHDADCAPPLRFACLPNPTRYMCFRIAVRAAEAWLLADRESLAQFLSVAVSLIPSSPETLDDPKQVMIDLAKRSRRRKIREAMVPRAGSGRKIGVLYNSVLIEFVQTRWKPEVAAAKSDSLRRCRERIRELVRSQV
jgi:hypothetical protein